MLKFPKLTNINLFIFFQRNFIQIKLIEANITRFSHSNAFVFRYKNGEYLDMPTLGAVILNVIFINWRPNNYVMYKAKIYRMFETHKKCVTSRFWWLTCTRKGDERQMRKLIWNQLLFIKYPYTRISMHMTDRKTLSCQKHFH